MAIPIEQVEKAMFAQHDALLLADHVRERAKVAGKARRPGSVSELRLKVLQIMKRRREQDVEFKDFIRGWGQEPIEGLRLERLTDDSYRVCDEDAIEEECRTYTWTTLRKFFSLS